MNDAAILAELRNAAGALGEAKAFVHIAGYSFGLGFTKIKWLLREERWRQCGFNSVEAFADSIQFDKSMKAAAEERKELVDLFKKADEAKPISNKKIAAALNVGASTIDRDAASIGAPSPKTAKENNGVQNHATPNGAPTLPSGERAARQVVNKVEGQAEKRERRATRERELADRILALPDKKYGVIYADPEWRFEVWSRETGMDRAVDNYYSTSVLDAIKSRAVPSIAADDCALFLWATAPMEPQAYEVMLAWGFAYKSQTIWDKGEDGTGYWFRNRHEILLVGTRGDVPAPAMGTQWPSVISAPVGAPSEKPEIFYELIEAYFPNLPKIELNARKRRPSWDAWGLEAPAKEAAE
jgi:N6-adenosine-specific RNA methylase IME4